MPEDVPGYRVLEQVGQGGFSAVYRAHQERLDRVVALKVLNVGAVDDTAMRRFTRECRITGRLTGHPHVVTVLDTGMTRGGAPFIAMEYFERGSLTDRLAREGPLPVPDVLRVGVKIASALAAVHEADVLHRDVKPQNVLVSRYGEPALTDFGIALLTESLDATHTTAFTPQHAAPEVLNGRTLRPTSDIYALGSTLYQLLAGGPAFHTEPGVGLAPLILRIVSEPPPAIPRGDLPASVFEAVRTAMAKSPDDRFPTAIAFATHLRQLQSDLGYPVTELPLSPTATPPPEIGPSHPSGGASPSGNAPGASASGWGAAGPGASGDTPATLLSRPGGPPQDGAPGDVRPADGRAGAVWPGDGRLGEDGPGDGRPGGGRAGAAWPGDGTPGVDPSGAGVAAFGPQPSGSEDPTTPAGRSPLDDVPPRLSFPAPGTGLPPETVPGPAASPRPASRTPAPPAAPASPGGEPPASGGGAFGAAGDAGGAPGQAAAAAHGRDVPGGFAPGGFAPASGDLGGAAPRNIPGAATSSEARGTGAGGAHGGDASDGAVPGGGAFSGPGLAESGFGGSGTSGDAPGRPGWAPAFPGPAAPGASIPPSAFAHPGVDAPAPNGTDPDPPAALPSAFHGPAAHPGSGGPDALPVPGSAPGSGRQDRPGSGPYGPYAPGAGAPPASTPQDMSGPGVRSPYASGPRAPYGSGPQATYGSGPRGGGAAIPHESGGGREARGAGVDGAEGSAAGREKKGRRGTWLAAGLAVAATGVAVGLGALLLARNGDDGAPADPPARARPTQSAGGNGQASKPGVPPAQIKLARPRAVRAHVVDHGRAVVLRWRLSPAARKIPIFVHKAPGDRRPVPLKNGARTATVGHLNPKLGYCFQVFTMVESGNPPTLAKARPVCIRGAVPR